MSSRQEIERTKNTLMLQEAADGGAAVDRLLFANARNLSRIGSHLRKLSPSVIVTCARGSSDHAATYGKYVFETLTGVPTASAAPSVASIYKAPAVHGNRLCIAISQSGRSPDLLATVESQRATGAYVVALVNDPSAPLCGIADDVVELSAGPERSVAATKSYIASIAALAALTAHWTADQPLLDALEALPEKLSAAFALDWSAALETLTKEHNLYVIGRGFGLGIAQEAALKLKETCGLHAEGFSAAEVKHGPMAIVGQGFPVLAFAGSDEAGRDVRDTTEMFRERGASVALADTQGAPGTLPAFAANPVLEPILMIQSFYRMANTLALWRGLDPDHPPYLRKVTSTL